MTDLEWLRLALYISIDVYSIDPNNNNIELSLKGKDVGDKDPAPKPERGEAKKITNGKRKHNDDDEGDDDGNVKVEKARKNLKRLRKGLRNLDML